MGLELCNNRKVWYLYIKDKMGANSHILEGAESFLEWKQRLGLADVTFRGPRFTWCNNRKGDDAVWERLDKAYISIDLFSHFPEIGVRNYAIQLSDHAHIELDLHLTYQTHRRPYTIEAWVFDQGECIETEKEGWREPGLVSNIYCVA